MAIPMSAKQALGGLVGSYALWKWLDSSYNISNDVGMLRKMLAIKNEVSAHIAEKHTIADIWAERCKANRKKIFFVFEDRQYTYGDIDKLSNRIANWGKSLNVGVGSVVALYMENRPEFVALWLAFAKLGAVTALLNNNLKGKPLLHSVTISGAKILIMGQECVEQVATVQEQLRADGFSIYAAGDLHKSTFGAPVQELVPVPFATNLDRLLRAHNEAAIPRKQRKGVEFTDKALLVYTSGTTGLPKAATIKHLRFYVMGEGFNKCFEVQPTDRIYTVLPLYHSAGGLCGVGMTMMSGATMILKRKFSASAFFDDCRVHKATVVQYIGELCRYLLAVPPSDKDKNHNVRIAIGNGLRPDIWGAFQDRFNIAEVGEFYGSTEGNASLFNHCTDKRAQGSVGHTGPLLRKVAQLRLVEFDVAADQPKRGPDGFCIECPPNVPGELLGPIDDSDPIRAFAGYHGNEKATSKKVLSDVFVKGDRYFRTGDLLKRDADGYWYFVDRIGDTFRWKGENVSTTEVAEVVSTFPGVSEVNVYGVEVPQQDGRACCCAMVASPDLDYAALVKHCKDNLPPYAMPLFIRLLPQIEVTGTFKHQKVELRKQGCDPSASSDPLMMLNAKAGTYEPFGQADYEKLKAIKSKL